VRVDGHRCGVEERILRPAQSLPAKARPRNDWALSSQFKSEIAIRMSSGNPFFVMCNHLHELLAVLGVLELVVSEVKGYEQRRCFPQAYVYDSGWQLALLMSSEWRVFLSPGMLLNFGIHNFVGGGSE
jgi:hypothetical protein